MLVMIVLRTARFAMLMVVHNASRHFPSIMDSVLHALMDMCMILMRQCAKAVNNPVAHAPSFQTTVLLVKQDITCWMVLV